MVDSAFSVSSTTSCMQCPSGAEFESSLDDLIDSTDKVPERDNPRGNLLEQADSVDLMRTKEMAKGGIERPTRGFLVPSPYLSQMNI
jgi:hypothetical protein